MWNSVPNKFVDLSQKIQQEVGELLAEARKNKASNSNLPQDEKPTVEHHLAKNHELYFGDCIDEEKELIKFEKLRETFVAHQCGPECVLKNNLVIDENILNSVNPFLEPFKIGFVRSFLKSTENSDYGIVYISPCGKILESFLKITKYLEVTGMADKLSIRNFTLSKNFRLARLKNNFQFFKEDISNGIGRKPVNFLAPNKNYLTKLGPYLKEPFYEEKTSKEVKKYARELQMCTHEDNFCIRNENQDDNCLCECARKNKVQYKYDRLFFSIREPIWECTSKCNCGKHCTNRVVSNGHENQLQVYPIPGKGFAIRATHFIPKGTYVMPYYGKLIKNKYHVPSCDEYVADTHFSFDQDNDTISIEPGSYSLSGAFANHSCYPNLFVQTVIKETDGYSTPVFGLFAMRDINAFEELTWDYNYGLTSVPYQCHCYDETCKLALR